MSKSKFILWNTRSAIGKIPVIMQYFADSESDFMVMTETWHAVPSPGKLDTFSATIKEFAKAELLGQVSIFSRARSSSKRGGGVALVAKPDSVSFSYYNLDFDKPSSFEYMSVKCKCNSPFILIVVYRIRSVTWSTFVHEFESLLTCLNFVPLPAALCGDFNIRINLPEESQSISFCNILYEYNFSILSLHCATHCGGNILDFVILSASLQERFQAGQVDTTNTISDHFPTYFHFTLSVSLAGNTNSSSYYRALSEIDSDLFSIDLQDALAPLNDSPSVGFREFLDNYNQTLKTVLDCHAPLQTRPPHKKSRPGWMDAEYVQARALRKRLQKLPDKTQYNIQNRYCSRLALTKWETYNNSLISTLAGGNQKQFYSVLRKLVGKDLNRCNFPSHEDPVALANTFNSFFVSKVESIRASLPATQIPSIADFDSTPSASDLLSLSPTDATELLEIISEHGVKTNPDDPLPSFLLAKYLDILLPHLVTLVNLSLSESCCDGIKEAYVVPILKSLNLDQDVLKNYRPVSLLTFVSKLAERVVHKRITQHLDDNNLNNPAQYGYKKHHGCESLLLKLIDDILVAVDNRSGVIVLFIDLSAAFDTVDHSILLNILYKKFRIKGSALQWIRSFLSNRVQRVKVGNSVSDAVVITFGVPQGSILGPLLFNLYCSSINEAFLSAGFDSIGYADDNFGIRMFPAFATPTALLQAIPDCLKALKQWTASHFLKLNSDKTQVMIFGDSQLKCQYSFTSFRNDEGDYMPITNSTKVLGVTLDCDLNFDKHVSNTVSSVNFALRNIRLVRKSMNDNAAATLVHSLVTNKLDQCNILLLGTSESNISKLQRLQNSAMRTVVNLPHRSYGISAILREHHWLPIKSRIIFKFVITVFKCLNNMAPQQLADKLLLKCPLNMILDNDLYRPKTGYGKRCFTYLAPRYWNAIPRDLRVIPDINSFKKELKFYLFDNTNNFLHRVDPYTTYSVSQPGRIYQFTNERL